MESISFYVLKGEERISEITIMKDSQGLYSYTHIGNFMLCPDCNARFSIHAKACHFCGCPMDYIIAYWYEYFYAEKVKKHKKIEQEQKIVEEVTIKNESRNKTTEDIICEKTESLRKGNLDILNPEQFCSPIKNIIYDINTKVAAIPSMQNSKQLEDDIFNLINCLKDLTIDKNL